LVNNWADCGRTQNRLVVTRTSLLSESGSCRAPGRAIPSKAPAKRDWQISGFGRYSSLFFTPGNNVGDVLYDGPAQTAYKRDEAYGVQG